MTTPDLTGWRLSRTGAGPAGLEPYEAALLDGLFGGSQEVRVADLRGKLGGTLSQARRQLRRDMARRGWIAGGRSGKIALFAVAGSVLVVAGLVLMPVLGAAFAGAWIGASVAFVGLVWICTCAAMVRRSRREAELWRRAASFRAYVRRGGAPPEALEASLPFAVAFGAERAWEAPADGSVARVPLRWFGAGTLASFWLFEGALYDSIAYVPPSTSSGGGSGWSGGSSGFDGGAGGGGGGGGGGSW